MRPLFAGRPGWVLPLLLMPVVVAVGLAVAGIVVAARTQTWLTSAMKVDGRVVALQPIGESAGAHAIVEAQASDGTLLRVTDPWASDPPPAIGSSVTLAYPAGKPSEAIVVGFRNLYGMPALLAGLGGIGATVWLVVALLLTRVWPRRPD